ncbi:hypothetical protein QTI24_21585 [Variovorax sp. J22P240]|uniref:hypothetical protein n=1 Tax=Variovorax sp. J22P240 TaxID=3053514 RepID=UPI002575DA86|nr:hypothetical protein [Variovorax sp. J22P240]MDM0001213.1 hypothetical protein [Variovorax sp. J22P240]
MRFEEDANGLTITWYPELEIGELPHEMGNKACAPPPKPSQAISAPPEKARSWRLIRKAFGPDAKFRLRLDKVDNKNPDVVYSLEVTNVRFGKLADRSLRFTFSHSPKEKEPSKGNWQVSLLTKMWSSAEKQSAALYFKDISIPPEEGAEKSAKCECDKAPEIPKERAFELTNVDASAALKQILADELRDVKVPVRLQLATNGVWSILPQEDGSKKPSPILLPDGRLALLRGLRMAWCDADPASLQGEAASHQPPNAIAEAKKGKDKSTPPGRLEMDPIFVAWGDASEGDLMLGAAAQRPRIALTAMTVKAQDIFKVAPTVAQQNAKDIPAAGAAPADAASSASAPASAASTVAASVVAPTPAPAVRAWPNCAEPEPPVDWKSIAGNPATSTALDRPPQWRFIRRDWSPKDLHQTGVSSIRAMWSAMIWTKAGRFGPICITDGVFQRGFESKGANMPTLRFAGRLSTTNWEIDTGIGKLLVKGAASDGSAIDPQKASARTHRPLMTLSSSGYGSALSSLDVPLLLLRSDLAPEGCEFSEFTFAPTGLRAVYDSDAAKARNDLRVSESYLWLGEPAAIREFPLARIDLTRARVDVARPESLARLGFMFAGLNLEIADGKAWITDPRASCRVRQRIEPSGNGEPIALDARPVLVAEFPPQHVFEEAVFRPSEAPLPDVALKDTSPFRVTLQDGATKTFSTSLAELLLQLDKLVCIEDHVRVRRDYQARKINQAKAAGEGSTFQEFVEAFERLCEDGATNGSLPPIARPVEGSDKCTTRAKDEILPPAYHIYIGPDELQPELMAIGRKANRSIRNKIIATLLDKSLANADRFIALLKGAEPEPPELMSQIVLIVKSVLAAMNPFKNTPELPVSPRDRARMLEQATSSVMQDYAQFRDFYAEWILRKPGSESLLPDDLEFFSPENTKEQDGLRFTPKPSVADRLTAAKKEYVNLLQSTQAPDPVMRARLSGTSRLAFHVDCGSRPRIDVEDGDAHTLAQGDAPGTRLPFSFDALTDWAHYDLAVTPRARQAATFDDAGTLIRREIGEEGSGEDDSSGSDIAMLKSLGIRSGQLTQRPQRSGRPRDWGKQLRTLQERLTDVEASLSVVPDDLQTAIELPARLILSPSQKGQWRTRRNNLPWAFAPLERPVPLWTAQLDVSGVNPLVRAVASPDMRAEFVRFGLDRSLFAHQRVALKENVLHSPAGAAPPRGPRAPWTLGFEESDPNTSPIERLYKATQTVPDNEKRSVESICAESKVGVAAAAAASAAAAAASAASAASTSAAASTASAPPSAAPPNGSASATVESLHPLVDYLCGRQIHRKEYGKHAVFRSTLDAYDRHEIVLLSSTWGLPVRGRREKTGELQALRFSSQVELPEEWRLLDAEAGTAIYRPRALKIQELALTALGGTLRHDSDFVPPAAARHIVHGPLFDSMSVERWQHWTVLGRDVFAEVVYKGYLFPIGHRASLVKQTERIFLAPAKKDSKEPDTHAPLRCYLRQRMFIRVARPEKAFPAYGQPNGGRMFPADVVRMLTLITPDIVDPAEDTTLPQAMSPAKMSVSPGGRLYANEAGLVFWPRTARIEGSEVVFEMQIQGAATKGKLLFVDNVAVNRPDLMDRLVRDYNKLDSPDVTADNRPDLQTPDPQKHLRTLDLHGQSLRYCDEIKPGSASHKTLSWTLKATGGVGVTNIPRPAGEDVKPNDYEGPVHQFDDPLLEGADQPPFFPAIHTARIRIDQVERLTGGNPQAALAQFEGWYVQNGFEPSKRTQETDRLGIYLDIVSKVTMDMGQNGSRSGGVMRPAGEVIALARERGPLTGTGRLDRAGVVDSVVGKESGFPLTPAPAPRPQRAFGPDDTTADPRNAKKAFNKFFSGNDALKTKILGLVSVSDLVEFLDVKSAASELPLLRDVVEYGMSGAEAASDSLRANVVVPLHQLILELDRQWDEAGKQAKAKSEGFVSGMGDVFPDVHSALQDLKNVLSATTSNADDAALLASLSEIYECGRRLMDACGRIAANPLDQLKVAVKRRLQGFNEKVGFVIDPDQLKIAYLQDVVNASLREFEKRLIDGAFALHRPLVDKWAALKTKLDNEDAALMQSFDVVREALQHAGTTVSNEIQSLDDLGKVATRTPLEYAQFVLVSLLRAFDTELRSVQTALDKVPRQKGKAADALNSFSLALDAAQRHTATAVDELHDPVVLARSEYQRTLTNFATLLRMRTMVNEIIKRPESLLSQVSQILSDYLLLQVGARFPDFPAFANEALKGVLAPVTNGATAVIGAIVDTGLTFPEALPDLTKDKPLDSGGWPITGNEGNLAALLYLVAVRAQEILLDPKFKDPKFDEVRKQLAGVGKTALAAQKDLHALAARVQLLTENLAGLDPKRLQASMQQIDSGLDHLQKLGESAIKVTGSLRDALIALSVEEAQRRLKPPILQAILRILDWFSTLNKALDSHLPENEPLVEPWKRRLKEYAQAIGNAQEFARTASLAQWRAEPNKLLPVLTNPIDVAEKTGAQAVLMLQRVVVDFVIDRTASLVEPVDIDSTVKQLASAFRPLLVLLKQAYVALRDERKKVFDAAGATAGQLLTGALLVRVDSHVIFVIGDPPTGEQIDATRPDRDQLHWDLQSLEQLVKAIDEGKLQSETRLRALNFMDYLVTGWRTSQSTPLRIIEQLKRISLEEIRARLLALINFGAIREEIEERIKLLIPSAVTMSYDFSTTMSERAEAATAGVFCPKEGCALTVRTRARVDLLQASAPTFLSIGELGAFDIRLLGSFDAVTLHFKGVRFTSRGGSPECDLQYEGFTIGKQLEYLSQLTPFFGSKAGSGFYLQPLDSGIGVEAGYRLDLGAFTVGNLAIFNVSLNAAARLPFDNRGATFVASLSRRDSPFTIAIAPYGGSGFFALEADTKGIVGFEVSFEYGGAGAFAYGPLSGQGRLMVGAYIRSRYDHTEIFATFYVGGSASIWIFNFGASLYVNAKQEGSQMKGTATYTFSFSMGIVDYDYKVAVNVALSLDGSSDDKAQKKQADKTVSGDAGRWQDETRPVRLASLEGKWSPGDVVSDVSTHPLALMIGASATAAVRKAANGGASMPPSTAKRRVATKCQTESWSTYSNYFDKDLAKKAQKLKAVY